MTRLLKFTKNSSKFPSSKLMHFATSVRWSRVVIFYFCKTIFLFKYYTKIKLTIIDLSFFITTHSTVVFLRFKHLCLGSELYSCSYKSFFSQWPIIFPPKILTFLLHHPVQCVCVCACMCVCVRLCVCIPLSLHEGVRHTGNWPYSATWN
jgi:hypothetical protein